jgi:hypothetical protein
MGVDSASPTVNILMHVDGLNLFEKGITSWLQFQFGPSRFESIQYILYCYISEWVWRRTRVYQKVQSPFNCGIPFGQLKKNKTKTSVFSWIIGPIRFSELNPSSPEEEIHKFTCEVFAFISDNLIGRGLVAKKSSDLQSKHHILLHVVFIKSPVQGDTEPSIRSTVCKKMNSDWNIQISAEGIDKWAPIFNKPMMGPRKSNELHFVLTDKCKRCIREHIQTIYAYIKQLF